jgi:hypothetical protein
LYLIFHIPEQIQTVTMTMMMNSMMTTIKLKFRFFYDVSGLSRGVIGQLTASLLHWIAPTTTLFQCLEEKCGRFSGLKEIYLTPLLFNFFIFEGVP